MPPIARWFHRAELWCFAPSERHQLGIFRVVLVAWVGWFFVTRVWDRLPRQAARPREFFEPVSLASWFPVPLPVEPEWVSVLRLAMAVLIVLALVGFLARLSLIGLALLNLYLGLAANSWGYTAHATALPTLVLIVLAVAPGATTFSLDSALCQRSARYRRLLGRPPSSARTWRRTSSVWPVRAVLILLCLVYFSAGASKLRYSGWRWTDGRTLAFYLAGGSERGAGETQRFMAAPTSQNDRFRDGWGLVDHAYVGKSTALGRWVAGQATLVRLLATFALLWELLFPLALLGKNWQRAMLVLGAGFHAGIELTLRINFLSYVVCYAIFFDWAKWLEVATRFNLPASVLGVAKHVASACGACGSFLGRARASILPSRSTRAGRAVRARATPSGSE